MSISTNNSTDDNARRIEELFKAKSVLFVGAHPDDIEFYCGGFIHLLWQRGVKITFAIATRGGKGRTGHAKSRLEAMRTFDQLNAAAVLCNSDLALVDSSTRVTREHEEHLKDIVAEAGVEVVFYDYPDKDLPNCVNALANDLGKLFAARKPDIIFSWDPDFIYNPHPDHQAAADAVRTAAKGRRVCYYGTRRPDMWIGFDDEALRVKISSIKAHRTESPWYYFDLLLKKRLLERLRSEGARIGAKYAEVLRCEE